MGKLDILAKEYTGRPSVFADVFNPFLYHGRQVIVPKRLVETRKSCAVLSVQGSVLNAWNGRRQRS